MPELTLSDARALAKKIVLVQLLVASVVLAAIGFALHSLGAPLGMFMSFATGAMLLLLVYAHSYDGVLRQIYNYLPTCETTTEPLENRRYSNGDAVFGGDD